MIHFFLEGGGQEELKDKNGLNMRDNLRGSYGQIK
jgi:hypothetical protein